MIKIKSIKHYLVKGTKRFIKISKKETRLTKLKREFNNLAGLEVYKVPKLHNDDKP